MCVYPCTLLTSEYDTVPAWTCVYELAHAFMQNDIHFFFVIQTQFEIQMSRTPPHAAEGSDDDDDRGGTRFGYIRVLRRTIIITMVQ